MTNQLEKATLGGGCFWCVEAVFQQVEGVQAVISGYAGGTTEKPTYQQVCSGNTGHAEVVQLAFDPSVISYREILDIFFRTHDPTTLNRQGADVGTQYRSAIFYHTPEQQAVAEQAKEAAQSLWDDPIVTEIAPLDTFYEAEAYHQNYYNDHSFQPYCMMVITPKVKKFKKQFPARLKETN